MISMLFAALCVAYDASGACTDRQVFPAGMWEGPTAAADCWAEMMASRRRLEAEGHDQHFLIYCEMENRTE